MDFYKTFFKDTDFDITNNRGEVQVLCPFPHSYDSKGNPIYESHASAGINVETGLFHCFTCGEGLNEVQFASKIQGVSIKDATLLLSKVGEESNNAEDWTIIHQALLDNKEKLQHLLDMGFSIQTINECQIGYEGTGVMSVPVFMYGVLMDVKQYHPNEKPKWKASHGSLAGLVTPFDLWVKDNRPTIMCAGEKDMLIARSLGYNAITVTGGEQSTPKYFKAYFKNKETYVIYDNDEAGIKGGKNLSLFLKECGAIVHNVTGHHLVCTEKGEDLYDYIIKYKRTADDLDNLLLSTPEFTDVEYKIEKKKEYPVVTLAESLLSKYRNKVITSLVQVTSVFDTQYSVADCVDFTKIITPDDNSVFSTINETKHYYLDDDNSQDILYLMENDKISNAYYKQLAHIPATEKGVSFKKKHHLTVYKASVIDFKESGVEDKEDNAPIETLCYLINVNIQNGKKYFFKYKMVAHPLDNQRLVMVVTEIEDANDSVSDFQITPQVKEHLSLFQGNPVEKMNEMFLRGKSIVGKFATEKIYHSVDLFYNTPLQFVYAHRLMRGYLDIMIIGETRTGKSKTAQCLLDVYQLGTFLSLKTATTVGLIGGSKTVNGGGWKNTIGAIPRNNKGAVIMEEFQGAPQNFISSLTDIRTSNKVHIVRADGELTVDAMVRMLTISNQASTKEGSKPLRSYPNGVSVISELIEASEDISRYDFFSIVEEPEEYTSPFAVVDILPKLADEAYQDRIRWIWSRKPEQIKFAQDVEPYIWEQAQQLNQKFNCHVKLFGSEADLKLARVSVAVAGCVCSCDANCENIIVTKDHVDWAVQWLNDLYDNDLFRLKEYAEEERSYTEIDDEIVTAVEEMYKMNTVLFTQLERSSMTTRQTLQSVSGCDATSFSTIINEMTRYKLIKWQNEKIVPTERFRKALRLIHKDTRVPTVGRTK